MKKIIFFFLFCSCSAAFSQTINQQWFATQTGTGDNTDKLSVIKSDNAGNFIMGGYTINPGAGKDFLLIKINAAGDTLWTRTYNGTGNGSDAITCLGIDAANNIYAGGYGKSITSGKDFLIIKYNPQGDTVWTRYHNGAGNADDLGVAMVVNAAGTVWMTGSSNASTTLNVNIDYETVCYNTGGTLLFNATYDNGGLNDYPAAITLLPSDNCAVTGKSYNNFDDDYVTITYNAVGTQVWMKRFDGGVGNDRATAITSDANSNVYVTGRADNGNDDDFVTLKYNSSGTQQFLKIFDGGNGNDRATGIGIDAAGDLFVCGRTRGSLADDVELIEYNSANGAVNAQVSYSTPASLNDRPYGMLVTSAGLCYIWGIADANTGGAGTNYEMMTLKYDHTTLGWAKFYSGTATNDDEAFGVATDANGNIVTAGYSTEISTLKDATWVVYNSAGTQTAAKHFNGQGDSSDKAVKVGIDDSGFSYAAGYAFMNGADHDFLTMKCDAGGNILWYKTFDGTGKNTDEVTDMVVDAAGNVYECGNSKNANGDYDILVIKYNTLGDTMWTRRYNGAANGDDQANSIILDHTGNVIVTGYSDGDNTIAVNNDFVTIKFSNAGATIWFKRWNSTFNNDDRASVVKVDAQDNVYVCGRSNNGANDDYKLLVYTPAGVVSWQSVYDGGIGNDQPVAMALDASGHAYLTGSSVTDTSAGFSNNDYLTVKVNNGGAINWTKTYNGAGNDDDLPAAMVIDKNGNIVVTGKGDVDTNDTIKNFDYITVQYDSTGHQNYANNYSGTAGGDDAAAAIVADDNGDVIITGQADDGTALVKNNNCTTVLYSPTGVGLWGISFDGNDHLSDAANDVINLGNTQLWIAGSSTASTTQKNMLLVKYNFTVGIKEPIVVNGFTVFPNPCSTLLNIQINSVNQLFLHHYEIRNTLGQLVSSSEFTNNQIQLSLNNLQSGAYFVQVFSGSDSIGTFTITKL